MRASARKLRQLTCAAAALLAAGALAAAPAGAEPAAGVLDGPAGSGATLALFDTAAPSFVTLRAISGFQSAGETVVGIDLRPATGEPYVVTVPRAAGPPATVRLYRLDIATAALTFVGTPAAVPGAADTEWGIDFNPTADRLRAVLFNRENFRVNPNNGALAGDDTDLTFSGGSIGPIIAAAYDRNVTGATRTTLYVIDRGTNQLAVQGGIDGAVFPGPNGGAVTPIGPLGVTLDVGASAGLDVSGATGTAYAMLRTGGGLTSLYTVNLTTGAATPIGALPLAMTDFTILPPPSVPSPPPPPPPPPGPPVPAGDRQAPKPLVDAADAAKFGRLVSGRVAIAFSCDEACRATVQLTAGRTTLATGAASIARAGTGTLKLTATRAGRRFLSARLNPRRRRVRATLSLVATDAAGNAARRLARRLLLTR